MLKLEVPKRQSPPNRRIQIQDGE
ncbi:hypothetical protein [Paenibacillus caui]